MTDALKIARKNLYFMRETVFLHTFSKQQSTGEFMSIYVSETQLAEHNLSKIAYIPVITKAYLGFTLFGTDETPGASRLFCATIYYACSSESATKSCAQINLFINKFPTNNSKIKKT